ncbi:MAG: hypothetical protein WC621_02210 [Patescibacteria group bacterium]
MLNGLRETSIDKPTTDTDKEKSDLVVDPEGKLKLNKETWELSSKARKMIENRCQSQKLTVKFLKDSVELTFPSGQTKTFPNEIAMQSILKVPNWY